MNTGQILLAMIIFHNRKILPASIKKFASMPVSLPKPQPKNYHTKASADVSPWEEAYLRFETPQEEIKKFVSRLLELGANEWPRDAAIVEIFCGRGNGLMALNQLGFLNIEGADFSAALVQKYQGPGKCYVADCRTLPFADNSKDIIIVQGGLHHLVKIPDDLELALKEAHRVLKTGGGLMIVEPWLTPFLTFVHYVSSNDLARRFSNKLDAFATMFYYEQETYLNWLSYPQEILTVIDRYFIARHKMISWGKLRFFGIKK